MTESKSDAAKKHQAWTKKNGDFLAIALLSALITIFIYVAMASPHWQVSGERFNFGFGANWDCQPVGYLEPVCTKKR